VSSDQRITTRLPIRVRVEYENIDDFLDDYTSNLSLGGMFIQTDQPLPQGARFRLRLTIVGRDKPVETFGEVRWVVQPSPAPGHIAGMGIQFDALHRSDRRAVERLLSQANDRLKKAA
jgi:uncharacterized protein (TIGR02266 family)